MITLLQVPVDTATQLTDTASLTNQVVAAPPAEIHFIDLLFQGGWVMIPLALLAFLGLVIFIERYITIRNASKSEANLMLSIKQYIHEGKLDHAITVCRNNRSPLSRMLEKGLRRIGRPIKEIEGAIENVGKLEVSKMEKNINILGIVAGIAPMLGFVGTIIGVIQIFHDVSIKGAIEIGTRRFICGDDYFSKRIGDRYRCLCTLPYPEHDGGTHHPAHGDRFNRIY